MGYPQPPCLLISSVLFEVKKKHLLTQAPTRSLSACLPALHSLDLLDCVGRLAPKITVPT